MFSYMVSFIIQARSGSTRLPNKILLPFYKDKCILDLMIEKLSSITNTNVLVATTLNSRDDRIVHVAEKHNVKCFRGEESDVLERFISAAEQNNINKIIRVCSDNPFLDVESIQELLETIQKNPSAEYISFDINGTPSIKTHYGFWTEYVTLDALRKVRDLTREPVYHEHVTNYIYSHPDKFDIVWIRSSASKLIEGIPVRLTIDTEVDFANAQKIYSDFEQMGIKHTIQGIVNYLSNQPSIISKMKVEIEKNSK